LARPAIASVLRKTSGQGCDHGQAAGRGQRASGLVLCRDHRGRPVRFRVGTGPRPGPASRSRPGSPSATSPPSLRRPVRAWPTWSGAACSSRTYGTSTPWTGSTWTRSRGRCRRGPPWARPSRWPGCWSRSTAWRCSPAPCDAVVTAGAQPGDIGAAPSGHAWPGIHRRACQGLLPGCHALQRRHNGGR